MKITSLTLRGFQQFQHLRLDFTDSHGKPLDEVCFIGPNATGKSTLLRCIFQGLQGLPLGQPLAGVSGPGTLAAWSLQEGMERVLLAGGNAVGPTVALRDEVMETEAWGRVLRDALQPDELRSIVQQLRATHGLGPDRLAGLQLGNPQTDCVVHVLPDAYQAGGHPLPQATLDEALRLYKVFPIFHSATVQQAEQFWKVLIFLVKKRESDWQSHLRLPENRTRVVEEVERDFDEGHPEILQVLARTWDRILGPAGLELDYQGAKRPVQLNENLEAFVKLRGSHAPIPYPALSSGIRNLLFRLGHVQALYFGRHVQRGFLLLDEPENALYPDLLYDLMDLYREVVQNTQLFVATHSPIVAAQFRPESRIILDFDEQGYVVSRRGVTPEGDAPNEMLLKDFAVRSLYGRVGNEKWERFLELKRLIRACQDPEERIKLLDEYTRIGTEYSFDPGSKPGP